MRPDLQAILDSDDVARLRRLEAETQSLKWKLDSLVESTCRTYGVSGELITEWEARVDALAEFLASEQLKARWTCREEETSSNPLGFREFEVRRVRHSIKALKDKGFTIVP